MSEKKIVIDADKLAETIEGLIVDVNGFCAESSVVIGLISNRVISVIVQTKDEAGFDEDGTESHGYECVTEQVPTEPAHLVQDYGVTEA